jgi:cytochrome bd ubiquinol oxidase subunit II
MILAEAIPLLNVIWYLLVGVLLAGYVVLDGFDLGVGVLHLFGRGDRERRILLNSIGPVWDGNEVWLVTGGGALFAMFPEVYATAFSGFYLAFMLLLYALIFRAVAIEFRSKRESPLWRGTWDVLFAISSLVGALLFGVALGNAAWGIPLTSPHEYAGTFLSLLNPYSLLVGATGVALFMMHGALYLVVKTEGDLQERVRGWAQNATIFFIIAYVMTTMVTLLYADRMTAHFKQYPVLFVIPLLNLLAVANIPRTLYYKKDIQGFLSSTVAILLLMALFGVGMFPYLIYSPVGPAENSLTLVNAASSPKTLWLGFIFALIGMPMVIAYTSGVYWVFRGKVRLEQTSY